MRLVIRADASPEIGGGHVVRSRAVAEALMARGWEACFAVRSAAARDVERLAGTIPVVAIDAPEDDEPRALVSRLPDGCDLLLVDHYGRGAAFESASRSWARRVMAIDDLPDRDHDCDLLVDPTAGREAGAYRGRVPGDARVLTGPIYAPLRAQFARARWDRAPGAPRKDGRFRILVAPGATDPGNLAGTVLRALETVEAEFSVTVVLSGAAPHLDDVRTTIETADYEARLQTDVADMASLMADIDLAIGAAGGAAWERCCLGLPSVVLRIADNQRDVLAGLASTGAAQPVDPPDSDAIGAAVVSLLADPARLDRMSRAAMRLCDGLGAARIALAIMGDVMAKDGAPVTLRLVEDSDATTLLDWQRDQETRRYARNSAVPTEVEHRAWFAAKRADPGCIFHLLECGGRSAGFVRLDRDRAKAAFEVSIVVAPDRRGLGVGRAGLELVHRLLPGERLLAFVKPDNEASLRLFAAAGYRPIGGDWYESARPTHG
jgi:UDP-2,4-diacetamido-2,4,6-trideoxy-beta-L-altropyranose hydrolase